MDLWTIFYWSWWIAWAPFVGMFIAKISAGRTIKVEKIFLKNYCVLHLDFYEKGSGEGGRPTTTIIRPSHILLIRATSKSSSFQYYFFLYVQRFQIRIFLKIWWLGRDIVEVGLPPLLMKH